jgi:AcrR family transcriptional regulator
MASKAAIIRSMDPVSDATDAALEPRRPGRPRSAEVDQAVLVATIELAGEVGVTRMSMDDVAERAKVSKATIYRRWASKEALVLDALQSAMSPLPDFDTGSVHGDLRAYLGQVVERVRKGRLTDVLPHLIGVACHDDAIRSKLDAYVELRRLPLRRILRRAVERGEIAPNVEIEVLIDALVAPFFYRQLLSNKSVGGRFVDTLLAVVLPPVED